MRKVCGVGDLTRAGLKMWRLLGSLALDDEEPKRSLCMHRTTFQSASFAMRKMTQLRYLSCLALSIAGDTHIILFVVQCMMNIRQVRKEKYVTTICSQR